MENVESNMKIAKVCALMTCHGRREKTLSCLESLFSNVSGQPGLDFSAVVVDDGSDDGTSEAIRQAFPDVHLIQGNGSLYWCGGMRAAMEYAMGVGYDLLLWMNDDVKLRKGALDTLVQSYRSVCESTGSSKNIMVGSTCDERSGALTYGGVVRSSSWHPFRYQPVVPVDHSQRCDAFNGNCVLIPKEVAVLVGNIDPRFTHAFGDIDYGLRAAGLGCGLWVAPGFSGYCARNPEEARWDSAARSLGDRLALFRSPKGFPIRETFVFSRRHGGLLWPLFWLMPIVRGTLLPGRFGGRR